MLPKRFRRARSLDLCAQLDRLPLHTFHRLGLPPLLPPPALGRSALSLSGSGDGSGDGSVASSANSTCNPNPSRPAIGGDIVTTAEDSADEDNVTVSALSLSLLLLEDEQEDEKEE